MRNLNCGGHVGITEKLLGTLIQVRLATWKLADTGMGCEFIGVYVSIAYETVFDDFCIDSLMRITVPVTIIGEFETFFILGKVTSEYWI